MYVSVTLFMTSVTEVTGFWCVALGESGELFMASNMDVCLCVCVCVCRRVCVCVCVQACVCHTTVAAGTQHSNAQHVLGQSPRRFTLCSVAVVTESLRRRGCVGGRWSDKDPCYLKMIAPPLSLSFSSVSFSSPLSPTSLFSAPFSHFPFFLKFKPITACPFLPFTVVSSICRC